MATARLLPLPLLALALLAAPAVDARPPGFPHPGHGPSARVDPACRRDARELCDDLERGESVAACLLEQRKDLSDECLAALEAPRLSRSDLRECREDTAEYCRHQRGARLAACLVRNKADLEGGCRTVVDSAQREQGLLPGKAAKEGKAGKADRKKAEKKAKADKKKKAARDDDEGDGGDDGEAGDAEAGAADAPER